MKRFLKLSRGERGFTLIELLIVIAILGIIAAVIIPNVGGILGTATVNAANTEAENVKVAGIAYYAENGTWTGVNEVTDPDYNYGYKGYLSGTPKATYTFYTSGATAGCIISATPTTPGGWLDIHWEEEEEGEPCTGHWVKGAE